MKDVRETLRDADPLRVEPALSAEEAERMRQTVLDAAVVPPTGSRVWQRAVALAALVVMLIGAGAIVGRRLAPRVPPATPDAAAPAPGDPGERLQVQFATPGGTRIIWTINPQFRVDEVMK